jgi:hypothetical protein
VIKLIGFKRFVILALLLGLNVAVVGAYFALLYPLLDPLQAQMNAVNAEINELRTKNASIKQDLAFLKDNLPKYDALKNGGFFMEPDRFLIGRKMEELRLKVGITSFGFTVDDAEEIPNADAAALGYRLISSHIKVERIISPFDMDTYTLLQEASSVFPEFVRIQKMEMRRSKEVTEGALKDISAGKPVSFVDAAAVFDWITMVPKPADQSPSVPGAPAGFRGQ